jgi:hypothetical protein
MEINDLSTWKSFLDAVGSEEGVPPDYFIAFMGY